MSTTMTIYSSVSGDEFAEAMQCDDEFAAAVISGFVSCVEPEQIAWAMPEDAVGGLLSFAQRLAKAYEQGEAADLPGEVAE
ncbi:MAG: hypothetical protein JXR35_03915 [Rhodobacteraceae bacterium]|nr:hypothetical protein [Paracoccaceae bacterium]